MVGSSDKENREERNEGSLEEITRKERNLHILQGLELYTSSQQKMIYEFWGMLNEEYLWRIYNVQMRHSIYR